MIDTQQSADQSKKDEEEDSDYNSEYYDEQGRYIWGEEGTDWEFYDDEDKEAYEKGLSVVPETLNPQALPQVFNPLVDEKTGVHAATIKA